MTHRGKVEGKVVRSLRGLGVRAGEEGEGLCLEQPDWPWGGEVGRSWRRHTGWVRWESTRNRGWGLEGFLQG